MIKIRLALLAIVIFLVGTFPSQVASDQKPNNIIENATSTLRFQTISPEALLVSQVIKESETGKDQNCYKHRGKSGEVGCWQLMPGTFKAYSYKVLGYQAEATDVNQRIIVNSTLSRLLEKHSVDQIFLKWNAGENTTKCSRGWNRYHVWYDSCKYVKDAMEKYNKLKNSK